MLQTLVIFSAFAANLLLVQSYSCSSHHKKLDVFTAFKCEHIQPDVVDVSPTELLEVDYNCGKSARLGNELTPLQVKDMPKLDWDAHKDCLYTLTFSDADAPSTENPEEREFLHWLVVNIPGKKVNKGDALVEYIGSAPDFGSGKHRYTFLVFKQRGHINPDGPVANSTTYDPRFKFHTQDFARKYHLGQPVAGNFYRAQWDEYVGF